MDCSFHFIGLNNLDICLNLFLGVIIYDILLLEEHVEQSYGLNNCPLDIQMGFYATHDYLNRLQEFDTLLVIVGLVLPLVSSRFYLHEWLELISEQ